MRRLISFTTLAAATLTIGWVSLISDRVEGKGKPGSVPYFLVDLGALPGGNLYQAEALDVNDPDGAGAMQVVGYSHRPVPDPSPGAQIADAVIWDVTDDGQILELTNIAPGIPANTGGWRVNDLGYILVTDLLWVPDVGYVTLPGLGGGNGSAEWCTNGDTPSCLTASRKLLNSFYRCWLESVFRERGDGSIGTCGSVCGG